MENKNIAVKCPKCNEIHIDVNGDLLKGRNNEVECDFCKFTFLVDVVSCK